MNFETASFILTLTFNDVRTRSLTHTIYCSRYLYNIHWDYLQN